MERVSNLRNLRAFVWERRMFKIRKKTKYEWSSRKKKGEIISNICNCLETQKIQTALKELNYSGFHPLNSAAINSFFFLITEYFSTVCL